MYRAGRASLRDAETVEDVLALQDSLVQAFFRLARSDALAAGEEPPSRSDPCFFNPQHGPAVVEVAWAPHGSRPVSTAVCRDDAMRIESGLSMEQRKEINLAVNGGYAQVHACLSVMEYQSSIGGP